MKEKKVWRGDQNEPISRKYEWNLETQEGKHKKPPRDTQTSKQSGIIPRAGRIHIQKAIPKRASV